MVMESRSPIDVIQRPSIVLPPGYTRAEDVSSALKAKQNENAPLLVLEQKEPTPEENEMKSLFEKFDATKSDSLGWVQKNEEKLAKDRIKEALGFDPPSMCGFHMAVVIHENHYIGTDSILYNPKMEEEKYRKPTGLVVAQGPWCYQGNQFKEFIGMRILRKLFGRWMSLPDKRPWCRVGDWVVLGRHEGQMINYRGKPIIMIPDTKIYAVVEDPNYVSRDF